MNRFHLALVGAALTITTGAAMAQDYPTQPVRMIIQNPPGGPSDAMWRGVAEILSAELGQPFLVENRPGGDGFIAMQACAAAKPDGHTLCMTQSYTTVVNPLVRQSMPMDPLTDLTQVTHLGFLPAGLLVHNSVPANTVEELLELGTESPGALNWATFGRSSSGTIYLEALRNERGVDFTNIPYGVALEAFQGLISGESDIMVYNVGSAAGQVQSGNIKLLAVTTDERLPNFPDVPTLAESGIDSVTIWFSLAAPTGTPEPILKRLHDTLTTKLFEDPAALERHVLGNGFAVYGAAGGGHDEIVELITAETAMYQRLLEAAGIEKE